MNTEQQNTTPPLTSSSSVLMYLASSSTLAGIDEGDLIILNTVEGGEKPVNDCRRREEGSYPRYERRFLWPLTKSSGRASGQTRTAPASEADIVSSERSSDHRARLAAEEGEEEAGRGGANDTDWQESMRRPSTMKESEESADASSSAEEEGEEVWFTMFRSLSPKNLRTASVSDSLAGTVLGRVSTTAMGGEGSSSSTRLGLLMDS